MQTAKPTITSKKDERAEWLQRRRINHHKALETIARSVGCETGGLTLWRQLRRLENWLTPYSVHHCNGTGGIDGDKWEAIKDQARVKLAKIFGGRIPANVFINSDPRGHALKLDCGDAGNVLPPIPQGLERDWGGNGILAAEID